MGTISQRIFDSKSDAVKRMLGYFSSSVPAVANIFQGSALAIGNASLVPSILTCQFNAGASTTGELSDVGSSIGDAGNEDWDYGTILTGYDNTLSTQGYIAQFAVNFGALGDSTIKSIGSSIRNQFSI